jgi:long-chain acyl-CoA synthetase
MEITRVFDLLDNYRELYSYKDNVLSGKENGTWVKYSASDYIELSDDFSCGILSMGLAKGDKIVTVSNNRPEWNFIDMGTAKAGVIHVPIYPTLSKDDYYYILNHCQPKILIVSDKLLYEKLKPIAGMANITKIYSINQIEGIENWQIILNNGRENKERLMPELQKIKDGIKPDDLFTLVYTSGTTGFPKGVMLSHNNMVNNFRETSKHLPYGAEITAMSFLPLSHIYERMVNYLYQFKGINIYYAENLSTISDNLNEVHPHIFCTVPRILELFFERILDKGHDLPYLKRLIFFWAIDLGKRFELENQNGWFYNLKHKIADKLVYSGIRKALGGQLKIVVSGGASLQDRLARFFFAIGFELVEGYGLSETSPAVAANNLVTRHVKIGSVGPALKGIEIKIAEDGEILCRGHNVMMGYYKEPHLTQEVIDSEGWFHTGDIGDFVNGTYLKITDRKKEIFKLSSGKYVAPQVIENKLKESEFIEQAMVIGENQKFASALIQPNFPFLHGWCSLNKIHFHNNDDMIINPEIVSQYNKVISEINEQLGQSEQIKRFRLVADEWSQYSGELSPTLKLKRKYIYEKYKDIIQQIFVSQKNS